MMRHLSQNHLSNDDLIREVYGVGAGGAHLRECAECSARMEALLRTKVRLRAEADSRLLASSAFFAAQRRAVYARLDRAAASYVRWAPAVAGAALLAVGLLLFPHARVRAPRTPVPAVQAESSDNDQLFSDLYSMEQSVEPSVDAPIQELFQESAAGGDQ
jgi:predicted anti-sigma-YlaC factor YlaD